MPQYQITKDLGPIKKGTEVKHFKVNSDLYSLTTAVPVYFSIVFHENAIPYLLEQGLIEEIKI